MEATVVVETYNLEEGTSSERLRGVLGAAAAMVEAHADAELVVLDVGGDDALWERLRALVPDARRVRATGLRYDQAKGKAAREARGEFVLYLDGDCLPEPGWLDAHLGVLAAPLLYAEALVHDWKRLAEDGASLGLSPAGRVAAALLAPVARLVDLAGMLRALAP